MDMAAYRKKKADGTASLQRLGKDYFQLVATRYNPDTGEEDVPEVANLNLAAVDRGIAEADAAIATITERKEGLLALKSEMEAADAAAPARVPGPPA